MSTIVTPMTWREASGDDGGDGVDAEAKSLYVRGIRRRQMNFEMSREPHYEFERRREI